MAPATVHGESRIPNKKIRKYRSKSWGDVFKASLIRGDDHGYAAYLADGWERRKSKLSLAPNDS